MSGYATVIYDPSVFPSHWSVWHPETHAKCDKCRRVGRVMIDIPHRDCVITVCQECASEIYDVFRSGTSLN